MRIKATKLSLEHLLLGGLTIFFFCIVALTNFAPVYGEQQFVYLAQSFLLGRLDFVDQPGSWADAAYFNGKYFWPLGPFSAIVLTPLVFFFGYAFAQGYLQFFITFGVFALAFAVAHKLGFSKSNSLWMALAFCFGSIYLGVALIPWSWYFAQTLTVLLLFGALYEYLTRRRWWLLGMLFGFIFATRLAAGFAIIFFALTLLLSKEVLKTQVRNLVLLFLPSVAALFFLFFYNYARFGDFFETGYQLQFFSGTEGIRKELYGLLSTGNILPNTYNFFFRLPFFHLLKNAPQGQFTSLGFFPVNFWVISPIFLWVFKTNIRERLVQLALIGSLPTLVMVLAFYGEALRFGPRYLLDVLPLWYLALLFAFGKKKLELHHKTVIGLSTVINIVFFLAFVGTPL